MQCASAHNPPAKHFMLGHSKLHAQQTMSDSLYHSHCAAVTCNASSRTCMTSRCHSAYEPYHRSQCNLVEQHLQARAETRYLPLCPRTASVRIVAVGHHERQHCTKSS